MYKIPLFRLNYDSTEENAVQEVLRSKWISSGPKCTELEDNLTKALHVPYALAVSSCTAALHLSMIAAGVRPGDEVIVPSLTFVATVNAVCYVGAVPVFCDIISPEQPTIDPDEIAKAVTKRTKAIVVMHYGGFPCDMDAIMEIADRYSLKVIEDACHGPLSEYHGKKIGTIGDFGCFSFFSNKNISTGEGGAVVTGDEDAYKKIKLLRSHGMTTMTYERSKGHATSYDVVELGYNYRMDDIRATLGIVQLQKLQEDIGKRSNVRSRYIGMLKDNDNLMIPFKEHAEISSSYIFPVVLTKGSNKIGNESARRDSVRARLAEAGVETSVHYPAVHRFRIYQKFPHENLTNTEYFSNNEISLPMYGSLTEEEVLYICEKVAKAVSSC